MFPPIQCSKSSYFTQWLLSEYLNRVESGGGGVGVSGGGGGVMTPNSSSTSSSSTNSSSSSSKLTSPASAVELTSVASSDVTVAAAAAAPRSVTPPPSSNHHNHHHHQHHHHATFTALKQLFSSHTKHHGSSSSNNKSNNNEYKNNNGLPPQQLQHHKTDPLSSPKNIEFIQMLALNALEFTAPIYSFLNKKQTPEQEKQQQQSQSPQQQDNNINLQHDKRQVATTTTAAKCPSTRTFVQLSGHPGSFAPAGPNSVWKKMPEDQGGSCCGRQQEGSGIGTSATLRELLQELSLKGDSISIEARRDSLKQSLALLTSPSSSPQRKVPPSCYLEEDTIPITVFFNSNGNDNDNPSASSSSNTTTTTSSTSTGGSSSTTTATMTTAATTTLMPPQICNIPFHMLPNENQVYRRVNSASPPDPLTRVIPKYITETCYNSQMFLELEDLLTNFEHGHPTIMDIKLGTRTFLEAEVKNNKPRPDLYQKLISVDPTACTQQEHEQKAVTKLTYMMFREKQSSSNSLGFRVEGVKIGDNGEYKCDKQLGVNFKMLREEPEICSVITTFCKGNSKLVSQFLKRLELIRDTLEQSEFFMTHEVIGCSLLFIHDEISVDLRLIDFAKTFEVGGGGSRRITHREPWVMGNREDGVLTGIDSLIRLFKRLNDQGIIGSSGNSDGNSKHDHDDDDDDDHDKLI